MRNLKTIGLSLRMPILLSPLWLLASCAQPSTYRPVLTDEEIRAEEINQQRMVDQVQAQGGMRKRWKNRPGMRKEFERVADRIEKAGADVCREMGIQKLDKYEPTSLSNIGRKHVQPKRSCYFYFEQSTSKKINAHADGMTVVMNAGMQRFVESEDELAVVMAHEVAHNIMAHPDAMMQNVRIASLIGTALDAVAATQGVNTGGSAGDMSTLASVMTYSPEFEAEADYIGLYILARAGYDLRQAPNFWRRMAIESPDNIYNSETHPTTAARFVAINKTIEEINQKRKNRERLLPEMLSEAQ